MEEEARFCAHCGAARDTEEERTEGTVPAHGEDASHAAPAAADEQAEKDAARKAQLQFMPYGSALLIILSVFTPWVSLGHMFDVTIMDVSKSLMLGIIAIACAAAYALAKRRRYAVGLAMAQSFVLFAAAAFFKYESMISELKRGFLGAMAGAAISLDWGAGIFVGGALCLAVDSVFLATAAEGEPFLMNVLIARWKELATEKLKLASIEVPAWAYSIVLAALLFLLFSQSKVSRIMH